MIVFIPAVYSYYEKYGYSLKQYDNVAMPIYNELLKRGIDTKWGTWQDEADAYVCTNPYKFGGKKHKLIYCPDGLGLQESVYQIYGGILFPGPYWRQIFESAYGESHGKTDTEKDPRYPSIGWPPLDLWFSSEKKEREEQLREELKLPYDKTVLFSGLYDGSGGYASEYMLDAINGFLDVCEEHRGFNVIYKGHVITTMNFNHNTIREDWIPLKKRMDELPYCNFVNPVETGNIFDYSLVSDIVVSGEGCTALTAFMAVGIPTIQLGMRWYTDIRSRIGESYIGAKKTIIGYSHSTKRFRPYPQIFMPGYVAEATNLPDVVSYALCYQDKHKNETDSFLKKILYKVDGKISIRAADAILEMKGALS